MQIHLALKHSNVWMFHDELKELGEREQCGSTLQHTVRMQALKII